MFSPGAAVEPTPCWADVWPFFDTYGNTASVISLIITVVGFALGLWRLWTIKREITNAKNEAKQAIDAAREDARRAVERVGLLLLSEEVGTLFRLITSLRDAARECQWPRAIDRGQDGQFYAVRLASSRYLTREESRALRRAADNLRLVVQYIENHRLPSISPEAATANLPDSKKRAMDGVVALLGNIHGRLRNTSLEI